MFIDYLHNATSGETTLSHAWVEHINDLEFYSDANAVEEDDIWGVTRDGHELPPKGGRSRGGPRGPKGGRGRRKGRGKHDKHEDAPPSPRYPSDKEHHHPHFPPPPPPPPSRGPHGPHEGCRGSPPPKGGGKIRYNAGKPAQHLSHKPVFAANVTLPTRLSNHTLDIHVAKFKYTIPVPGHGKDVYTTKLFVNHQAIVFADVPARNGAFHVISKVLNPRPHSHKPKKPQGGKNLAHDDDGGDDEWEDWEDWLIQWADDTESF